ncbi:MAG: hypothetical protein RL148_1775, partial [Planctomycetota bacterium]
RGRFSKFNQFGQGNPLAKRAQALRTAAMQAVTEDDLRQVVAVLITFAKAGDVQAARLLLERTLGKPRDGDEPDLGPVDGNPTTLPEAAQRVLAQLATGQTTLEAAERALGLLDRIGGLWHLPQLEARLKALEATKR